MGKRKASGGYRPKKRKFIGNIHTRKQDDSLETGECSHGRGSSASVTPTPPPTTSSKAKLESHVTNDIDVEEELTGAR